MISNQLRATTHQADIKELEMTKSNCVVSVNPGLGKKVAQRKDCLYQQVAVGWIDHSKRENRRRTRTADVPSINKHSQCLLIPPISPIVVYSKF